MTRRQSKVLALFLVALSPWGTICSQNPDYVFRAESLVAAPGESATVSVFLDNTGLALGGWSYGVCHDSGVASIASVEDGPALLDPDPAVSFNFIFAEGWAQSVVYDVFPVHPGPLDPALDLEIARATYLPVAGTGFTSLDFCDTLGSPTFDVIVIPDATGVAETPVTEDGSVAWGSSSGAFRRGDVNDDQGVDIADAIFLLDELFGSGPPAPCRDAADANDDGNLDVADAISILDFLFGTTGMLPSPGARTCGADPTTDALSCAISACP